MAIETPVLQTQMAYTVTTLVTESQELHGLLKSWEQSHDPAHRDKLLHGLHRRATTMEAMLNDVVRYSHILIKRKEKQCPSKPK